MKGRGDLGPTLILENMGISRALIKILIIWIPARQYLGPYDSLKTNTWVYVET
jgi:hypothetical protein